LKREKVVRSYVRRKRGVATKFIRVKAYKRVGRKLGKPTKNPIKTVAIFRRGNDSVQYSYYKDPNGLFAAMRRKKKGI
jgi:hypothetical protein